MNGRFLFPGRSLTAEQNRTVEAVFDLHVAGLGDVRMPLFTICLAYYLETTVEDASDRVEWLLAFLEDVARSVGLDFEDCD